MALNPALAILALGAISNASLADANFARLVSIIPNRNPAPVMSLYLDYAAETPKNAVVNTLAATYLSPRRLELFKAIEAFHQRAMSARNPLAHWMIGFCKEVPNALILRDPRLWLREADKIHKQHKAARRAFKALDQSGMEASIKAMEEMHEENAALFSAYVQKDFEDLSALLMKSNEFITEFDVLMTFDRANHPEGVQKAQQLAQTPEIRSLILKRRKALKAQKAKLRSQRAQNLSG
ncbi:MAG: hypothetical protein H0U98_07785 [Alphaproteobacteria bacterium]|nr:hypothetical protein [Alphaproteobacteria bacterium]